MVFVDDMIINTWIMTYVAPPLGGGSVVDMRNIYCCTSGTRYVVIEQIPSVPTLSVFFGRGSEVSKQQCLCTVGAPI